jgi:hypothetical protein
MSTAHKTFVCWWRQKGDLAALVILTSNCCSSGQTVIYRFRGAASCFVSGHPQVTADGEAGRKIYKRNLLAMEYFVCNSETCQKQRAKISLVGAQSAPVSVCKLDRFYASVSRSDGSAVDLPAVTFMVTVALFGPRTLCTVTNI